MAREVPKPITAKDLAAIFRGEAAAWRKTANSEYSSEVQKGLDIILAGFLDCLALRLEIFTKTEITQKSRQHQAIKVWPFYDAPEEYRKLSPHGGDEDWLAFVPDGYDYIPWMESGTKFGVCHTSEIKVEGGIIRIGSHA